MALSQDSLRKIDRELAKFPADQRQSAVMAALRIAQTEQGWLSSEVMQEIADYIGMPAIAVYEVASFYTMYNLKPVGKHKLTVCTNLPCQLQGATACAEHARKKTGYRIRRNHRRWPVHTEGRQCFGACGDAPVFTVNNHDVRVKVTPERFDALVDNSARRHRRKTCTSDRISIRRCLPISGSTTPMTGASAPTNREGLRGPEEDPRREDHA